MSFEVAPTTVLIADKQPLTAAGLARFLEDLGDVKVLGFVANANQLRSLIKENPPDVLIVDYNLDGYISRDDLSEVKSYSPDTNILVISSDSNKAAILQVLQLGVLGYVTKYCSREEITQAINAVAKGEKFYCAKILDIIMEKHFSASPPDAPTSSLTARETEILTLLASGYSTQDVADELHLSPHTVHTHRKSIIRKLSIKSPTEFVIYALDFGLIKAK
ncbi:response regulator transcription factor [Chryseolinea sp. T2]|uniref:response regulator transcription factor n=1 Tax=Chryseolinea sp. T2 TaxID=3129255 RepID=UPI00307808F2